MGVLTGGKTPRSPDPSSGKSRSVQSGPSRGSLTWSEGVLLAMLSSAVGDNGFRDWRVEIRWADSGRGTLGRTLLTEMMSVALLDALVPLRRPGPETESACGKVRRARPIHNIRRVGVGVFGVEAPGIPPGDGCVFHSAGCLMAKGSGEPVGFDCPRVSSLRRLLQDMTDKLFR